MTSEIDYLDRPPSGWFIHHVCRETGRGWAWVALMLDRDPEDDDFRRWGTVRECWVRIPGKHRSWDSANTAAKDMIATRH